jgi:hypothetical protein
MPMSCILMYIPPRLSSGLLRGQLNKTIDLAEYLPMTGANEIPAGVTHCNW